MKQAIQTCMATVLSLFATVITAHPGHEHGTWESMIMHILFYGIVIVGLIGVVKFISRNKQL